MTTTAATWFFRRPEKNPYLIAERVRTTFWDQRIGGLWLDTVSAETPIKMAGHYNGSSISMEWEPSQWLRLAMKPGAPPLANCLTNLLLRKPSLRYEDADGNTVWEWWIERAAGDHRWQAIQGKPSFGSPVRQDK